MHERIVRRGMKRTCQQIVVRLAHAGRPVARSARDVKMRLFACVLRRRGAGGGSAAQQRAMAVARTRLETAGPRNGGGEGKIDGEAVETPR